MLLTYLTPTIYFWLSNEPVEEEETPVWPPKKMPLPTKHPQTINLFWHMIPPKFSGKQTEFQNFVSSLRIYFDLNKWSFMGDKEKVLFMMSHL